jgi:NADP-dependent 3-hydroxy acid dehydrogenase YdfG
MPTGHPRTTLVTGASSGIGAAIAVEMAAYGLRDARMLAQNNLGTLMPDDVARAVVQAVAQPRHVLVDTIELQPSVPRRTRAS